MTLSLLAGAGLLGACGDGDEKPMEPPTEPVPQVSTVTVSPDSVLLTKAGDTQDFDATAKDQNGNTMSGVSFSWSVSDTSVASVDGNGTTTAKAEGTVEVKAELSEVIGSSSLTVDSLARTTILAPDSAEVLNHGDTLTLHGAATDRQGDSLPPSNLQWKSNIDGNLGTGDSLDVADLSVDTHWLILEPTTSSTPTDSVSVVINRDIQSVDREATEEDSTSGFIVGRLAIRYRLGKVANSVIARVNRDYGLRSQHYLSEIGVYVATAETSADSTLSLVDRLNSDTVVQAATVDALLKTNAAGDLQDSPDQYHHTLTGTNLLWSRLREQGVNSPGRRPNGGRVRIAVIDHGFDLSHSEFRQEGKVIAPADIGLSGVTQGEDAVSDHPDHGTHVASVAAGGNEGNDGIVGVAPGAALVPIQTGSNLELALAIEYAVGAGADLINISLAPDRSALQSGGRSLIGTQLGPAVTDALESGVPVVVASGNCDADYSSVNPLAGAADGVIVVGGTGTQGSDIFDLPDDKGEKGACSSDVFRSQTGAAVDLVAPGQWIRAAEAGTDDGVVSRSGTSAAAPLVSGIIAAYISEGQSPEEAIEYVTSTTLDLAGDGGDSLSTDGWDNRTGHGRVIGGVGLKDISPSTVKPGGSVTITAKGRNFGKQATVSVGDREVEPIEVLSHEKLTFEFTAPDSETEVDPVSWTGERFGSQAAAASFRSS